MKRTLTILCLLICCGHNGLLAQVDLQLTRVASLFGVVDIKSAGDGSDRLFLVRKSGSVHIIRGGQLLDTPFVDIAGLINDQASEQGLLSLAFSPDYASDGEFYLYFTDPDGASTIARFRVTLDADVADPSSVETIFSIDQPFTNHNGGRLEFGPDEMLYLGIGDGGGAGDPLLAGQDLSTYLGKIIRIDVRGDTGYAIPPDNPLQGVDGALAEIWAYGVRNPWRMAFDRMTGDLYIADVGQSSIEEINFQSANDPGGANYGWNDFEGSACFQGDCDATGKTFPVFEYSHAGGNCSITGGHVYRGADYPGLFGLYLYGDFCSGNIWGLSQQEGQWSNQLLMGNAPGGVLTFGEDERGNVYVSLAAGIAESGVFLLSDGVPSSTGLTINQGLSGAWFDPATSGQGFLIDIEPVQQFMFVAWFTFSEAAAKLGAPDQRWLTAQGNYSGSQAELTLFSSDGGRFDDPQLVNTVAVGRLSVSFENCTQASFEYQLDDPLLSGQIDLVRLVAGSELLCQSLSGR